MVAYFIVIEPKLVFRSSFPSPLPTVPLIRSLLSEPFTVIGRSVSIEPKLVARSTWPENPGGAANSILPYEVDTFAMISDGVEAEQTISIAPKLDLAVSSGDVIFRQVMLP